jgi:hypothetical protein
MRAPHPLAWVNSTNGRIRSLFSTITVYRACEDAKARHRIKKDPATTLQ